LIFDKSTNRLNGSNPGLTYPEQGDNSVLTLVRSRVVHGGINQINQGRPKFSQLPLLSINNYTLGGLNHG